MTTERTIFLGDTHGRDTWKTILDREVFDRVVFLGDYFDSFNISGPEQLANFLEIVDFKKKSDIPVIMLVGNHDFHYMPFFNDTPYSGFQSGMLWDFAFALKENMEHLSMAYAFDNILCSHAGISYEWLTRTFGPEHDESCENWSSTDLSGLVDLINSYFINKPKVFDFNGWDLYGNDTYQTPIWIRPEALMRVNQDTGLEEQAVQIVGHTRVTSIVDSVEQCKKFFKGRYYMIDAIETGGYLALGEQGFEGLTL
jgi:hypothetical protein